MCVRVRACVRACVRVCVDACPHDFVRAGFGVLRECPCAHACNRYKRATKYERATKYVHMYERARRLSMPLYIECKLSGGEGSFFYRINNLFLAVKHNDINGD